MTRHRKYRLDASLNNEILAINCRSISVLHHFTTSSSFVGFFIVFFFFLQNVKKLGRLDDEKHKNKWGWPNSRPDFS